MNNRIIKLFKKKQNGILSLYFTAGFPNLNDTVAILKAIERYGGDLVEIGIPFSDPLADGPVIQASNRKALENGMRLKLLFEQLTDIRKSIKIPLILMGYINPIMQFGVDKFCEACARAGIDGAIIPDLPVHEYVNEYVAVFEKHSLLNIFLITPQTSDERIKYIDKHSGGFIYSVSTSSTTGGEKKVENSIEYFRRIKGMELNNPTLIGFNVKDKDSFTTGCKYANGAIIGSAFIESLDNCNDLDAKIKSFISDLF